MTIPYGTIGGAAALVGSGFLFRRIGKSAASIVTGSVSLLLGIAFGAAWFAFFFGPGDLVPVRLAYSSVASFRDGGSIILSPTQGQAWRLMPYIYRDPVSPYRDWTREELIGKLRQSSVATIWVPRHRTLIDGLETDAVYIDPAIGARFEAKTERQFILLGVVFSVAGAFFIFKGLRRPKTPDRRAPRTQFALYSIVARRGLAQQSLPLGGTTRAPSSEPRSVAVGVSSGPVYEA